MGAVLTFCSGWTGQQSSYFKFPTITGMTKCMPLCLAFFCWDGVLQTFLLGLAWHLNPLGVAGMTGVSHLGLAPSFELQSVVVSVSSLLPFQYASSNGGSHWSIHTPCVFTTLHSFFFTPSWDGGWLLAVLLREKGQCQDFSHLWLGER
jgi:hypothetical protein